MKMMVPFIPAKVLKQQFEVHGHFYSLDVSGPDLLKCRNVLEIRSRAAPKDMLVDAVFIMMNPGSSRPINEVDYVVNSTHISQLEGQLVPTVPDTTQYQVMRVMHYSDWQYVRVINLSDLRDPKSGSFVERYAQLERESGIETHSIFALDRTNQLRRYLSRKTAAPIVCAWGVSNGLNPLIKRAVNALVSEPGLTGLVKPDQQGKFFHPLPTLQRDKERWVTQMLSLLQPNNSFKPKPLRGSA